MYINNKDMATKQKANSPNVVLTMPEVIKRIARERSIEICDDYRSLSKFITALILLDAKYNLFETYGNDIFNFISQAKGVDSREEYNLFLTKLLAA